MNTFVIIILIAIACYLIYLLLAKYILPNPLNRIGKEKIPLSERSQVITGEELRLPWTSTSGSSLLFYINPVVMDRTGVSGNEYADVVKIGSKQIFRILVAPDAGRDQMLSPAQLVVHVNGHNLPEIIDIPHFPLQRWTAVAIVKDGRKFNIYLNGKLTVSHMCLAMPAYESTQGITVGDARLTGEIALMSIASYAMPPNEIRETVSETVDTSGKPYLSYNLFAMFMPDMSAGVWCFFGNCANLKNISPLQQWTAPYA
jgi:hypothetical protein